MASTHMVWYGKGLHGMILIVMVWHGKGLNGMASTDMVWYGKGLNGIKSTDLAGMVKCCMAWHQLTLHSMA